MSDIRDHLSEIIRDHADFTVSVLALVILALCAVTWLWARQTRVLSRQLARERAAQRAMLPAPSAAVVATVPSTNGHREVQREGRPVYSVATREEAVVPAVPAAPVAQDSLGWVLPAAAAGEVVAVAAPDPPAPLEDDQSAEPETWAPLSEPPPPEPARPELEAGASATPAAWALPVAAAAPALAWSPPAPSPAPESPDTTVPTSEPTPDPLLVEDDENVAPGWSLRTLGGPTPSASTD
jgi:hypothetical protein